MYYLTGLLGLAAVVAPFLFSYSGDIAALWTSLIVGAILILASFIEGLTDDKGRWEYWVAGIVGLGAIIAPFALGFSASTAAVWTMMIIGIVAIGAAGTKLTSGTTRFGY